MTKRTRERQWWRASRTIAVLLSTAFAVGFAALGIARYRAYGTALFDMGAIEQSLWHAIHGMGLFNTVDPVSPTYLGNHFSPAFILVAIPYLFVPSTETLIVTQAVLLAAAAIPLYLVVRDRSGSPGLGLAIGLVYLLYPATHGAMLFDVHETALVPLGVALTLLFLERRPGGPAFWAAFAFMLLSRDEMAFVGIVLGLVIGLSYRRWKLAAGVTAVAAVWAVLVFAVFVPALGDQRVQAMRFESRYGHLGATAGEVVDTILAEPDEVWDHLTEPDKTAYYHRLLVPFGYLSLLGGWSALTAIPIVALHALARYKPQYSVAFHYSVAVGPLLAFSAARAVDRISRLRRRNRMWVKHVLGLGLVVAATGSTMGFGLHSDKDDFPPARYERTAYDETADRFAHLIPPDASLSADNLLGSHFARRQVLTEFPKDERAEYVLASTRAEKIRPSTVSVEGYLAAVQRRLRSPAWEVIREEDGIVLLRRVSDVPAAPAPLPSATPMRAAVTLLVAVVTLAWLTRSDDLDLQQVAQELRTLARTPVSPVGAARGINPRGHLVIADGRGERSPAAQRRLR